MRTFLLSLLCFLCVPSFVHATFLLEEMRSDTTSRVSVYLVATTTAINAVEGTLTLPDDVSVPTVFTGGSIISYWLETPTASGNTIRFAGIIPGGFTGSARSGEGLHGPGALLSFETNKPVEEVRVADAALYMNDGKGTRIALSDELMQTEERVGTFTTDRTPPEYIDVQSFRDTRVLEGRPSLIISSFDADSGIAYFEVQEGRSAWERTGYLYAVRDRFGLVPLSVRAYDYAGNFIETRVAGRHTGIAVVSALVFALLILCVVVWRVYWRKRRV